MVWRNNVQLNVWQENDPMKFMTVESGEYILAVPELSNFARDSSHLLNSQAQEQTPRGAKEDTSFKKVVMKLSGKVSWQAGLMFERELADGKRSFEFGPHYDVTLKNPTHIKSIKDDVRLRPLWWKCASLMIAGTIRRLQRLPQQPYSHVYSHIGSLRPRLEYSESKLRG